MTVELRPLTFDDAAVVLAINEASVHHLAPLVWREKIARERLLERARTRQPLRPCSFG